MAVDTKLRDVTLSMMDVVSEMNQGGRAMILKRRMVVLSISRRMMLQSISRQSQNMFAVYSVHKCIQCIYMYTYVNIHINVYCVYNREIIVYLYVYIHINVYCVYNREIYIEDGARTMCGVHSVQQIGLGERYVLIWTGEVHMGCITGISKEQFLGGGV